MTSYLTSDEISEPTLISSVNSENLFQNHQSTLMSPSLQVYSAHTQTASVSPKVTAICTNKETERKYFVSLSLSLSSLSNSIQFKMVIGIEIYEFGKANTCSKSSNPSPLPIFLTQSILLCFLVVDLLLIILMVDALQKFYVVSGVEFHHLFFLCLFGWNNTGTQSNDQQESCTIQICKYMK